MSSTSKNFGLIFFMRHARLFIAINVVVYVMIMSGAENGCRINYYAEAAARGTGARFNYKQASDSNSEQKQQEVRRNGYYSWDVTYKYSAIRSSQQSRLMAVLKEQQEKIKDIRRTMDDEYMGHMQMLVERDRHRHVSRRLLETDAYYSFAPANETQRYDSMGGLHYTYVTLGSPGLSFLVALDTGSDLLWVPCDCQQCAPTDWTNYLGQSAQGEEFAVYSPSKSNSSGIVMCDDEMCPSIVSNCTNNSNSKCTYVVNYMATDTSTSGVIVEDLLHLNAEVIVNGSTSTNAAEGGTTTIYFGCAEVQTGDLLEGVAPNGLLGLGPNDLSVPNTLAGNGIASNSFSLCFSSSDSSGRLIFGTQAKPGVRNTSLVPSNIYYLLTPSRITVGGDSTVSTSASLIFDTGTSYTTLPNSIFAKLAALFNQKITLPRYTSTQQIFSYCWRVSGSADLASLPNISITFSEESIWEIADPYEYLYDTNGNIGAACLAILNGTSTGIIGYNFMPGYEYFLNQEYMTFSWAPSDCYNLNQSTIGTRQSSNTNKLSSSPNSSPQSTPHSTQFLIFSLLLTTLITLI